MLFVVVGLFFINPAQFTFTETPSFASFSSAVFVLVYVFSGFEAVLVNSGEIRQPQRVIPFALTVALSAAVVLFLLIQIVCIGVLPNLANSERPLADASYQFLGTLGPTIISIGALVSIFGTLNVIMLACTRLPFAMATHGPATSAACARAQAISHSSRVDPDFCGCGINDCVAGDVHLCSENYCDHASNCLREHVRGAADSTTSTSCGSLGFI